MNQATANSSQGILVFGGTFDPPHLAHAELPAKAALQLGCDQILYVPAAINPLKAESPPTENEHRLAMLLLAIGDVPGAKISTIELDRPGPSYTVDTLRTIHQQFQALGSPKIYLLIGADQALDFHRWKDWQEILQLARPAVMLRPPWDLKAFEAGLRQRYSPQEAKQWIAWTLRLPVMDINATEIRRRLADHKPVDAFVHPAVAQYIKSNKLYCKTAAVSPRS